MSPSARGNISLLIIIVLAILSIVIVLGLSFNLIGMHQLFNQQPAAKQTKVYKIVGVNPNKKVFGDLEKGFQDRLQQLGYTQGQNLSYEGIELSKDKPKLQQTLDSLVKANPDLLIAYTIDAILPLYKTELNLKTKIPLIASSMFDVREIDITNYNGSGSFTASVTSSGPELNKKRLQVIKQVLPKAEKVGILADPNYPNYRGSVEPIKDAAPSLGLKVVEYKISNQSQLDQTLNDFKKGDIDILMTAAQPLFANNLDKIFSIVTDKGIATIDFRLTSQNNVLITYAHIFYEIGVQSADMADKILKGEKPGIIPVEEPKKVSFIINLKIAKKLGILIPDAVLSQTDKVIK